MKNKKKKFLQSYIFNNGCGVCEFSHDKNIKNTEILFKLCSNNLNHVSSLEFILDKEDMCNLKRLIDDSFNFMCDLSQDW